MNKSFLSGRAVNVPEVRLVNANGVQRKVANFRLAEPTGRKNPDGTRVTNFYQIACWDNFADVAAQYITKGKWLEIEGRYSWKAQKGVNAHGEEQIYVNVTLNANSIDFGPDSMAVQQERQAARATAAQAPAAPAPQAAPRTAPAAQAPAAPAPQATPRTAPAAQAPVYTPQKEEPCCTVAEAPCPIPMYDEPAAVDEKAEDQEYQEFMKWKQAQQRKAAAPHISAPVDYMEDSSNFPL